MTLHGSHLGSAHLGLVSRRTESPIADGFREHHKLRRERNWGLKLESRGQLHEKR